MAAPAFFLPMLLGAAAAGVGALAMKGSSPSPPPVPAAPPPVAPAAAPTTEKPQKTGMQGSPSFLGGAAQAGLPGADAIGGQKTLLGA